ncbi:MAG: hypothetical protein ACE5LV_07115, partial [Candidatus Aminicenantales bacterium]
GEVALCLWKALSSYGDLFPRGTFQRLDGGKIHLRIGEEEKVAEVSPETFLVRNFEGERFLTPQLYLLGGEEVSWVDGDNGIRLLEVVYPPHSNVLDRDSSHHSWQVRSSREALERRIQQHYPIGDLIDLVPLRRGESNRVAELLIKGSESEAVVKGLRIRRVLGLRDTLFVIERERDSGGNLTHFIFTGRGWGHGVGLCQVGAFGMARAGANYREILKKYYRGIKISRIY